MGIIVYIIVFGLVFLILAPFIAGHMKNVRKDKMMKKALKDSGDAAGFSLSVSDSWKGSYAIGIDPDKRMLFYMSRAGGSGYEISADLSEIKDCRADVTARTEKTPNGNVTVVEVISLVLTYIDRSLTGKRLEFYNNEVFPSLESERVLAEKWQNIISTAIQTKKSQAV